MANSASLCSALVRGWSSALLLLPIVAWAQLTERPGGSRDDPIDKPRDLSGLSIKNPRVKIIHTTNPAQAGGSMYLQQVDPWLGYQWGRSIFQREFRVRDGIYGEAGKLAGPTLSDGATKMASRGTANSCATCHNTPYRDAGAGATIAKNAGSGRNTPHMFGAGLLEMIGLQLRLRALAIADANRDGWISKAEAKGRRCRIANLPEEISGKRVVVDYGGFDDNDGDGRPDLNDIFKPFFVDEKGQRIAFATGLNFGGVAGYNLEAQVFGFGHLYLATKPPISPTIRAFCANPFDLHLGLQAYDPTTLNDANGDGLSRVSNAGALQFATAIGRDRGKVKGPTGISRDDPDRDGYCEELSEGELDMIEWFLLNHPAPARGDTTSDVRRGEKLFARIGCAHCHGPDHHLFGANPSAADYTKRFDGDRRFFELETAFNTKRHRLDGRLVRLAEKKKDRWLPTRRAYTIRSVYSDFKYHDLGSDFAQVQFDGTVIRQWKTTPLWGVGSTAPYGHDGASLNLDSVIRRHGGAALNAREQYTKLPGKKRRQIIAFLQSLILFQTDQLPCDINGNGRIEENFKVAGRDTLTERFHPEWLFKHPGRIEGDIPNLQGYPIKSFALSNTAQAYGMDLPFLRDRDHDGFPDLIDPKPAQRGFRDGEK